jgi:hypothetical protein
MHNFGPSIDFETSERQIERHHRSTLIPLTFFKFREQAASAGMPTGWAFAGNPAEFSTELSTGKLWIGKIST